MDARTFDPEDAILVTHPDLGLPGGWVTTEVVPHSGGLSRRNTVVEGRHILQGTVTRTLRETVNGELVIRTVGVGVSNTTLPGPRGTPVPIGPLIDSVNEPLGRSVFNASLHEI